MKKIKTTVSYKVSDGMYCNLRFEKHKGFPVEQRCRFCTNLGKNGFVCVLHNMPLVVEEGHLIRKSQACMRNIAYRSQTVPDEVEQPKVKPKDLVKWSITEYNKLLSEGYPTAIATKAILEGLKDG